MIAEEQYLKRCFDLAKLGHGRVSPNPLVGAVIVYQNRIIGEGYHAAYGEAHAEVNAIASVKEEDIPFLKESTIFISFEPCCTYGNTPPCTDLIIKHRIPKVVFSCIDKTPLVNGKSVEILRDSGCSVHFGLLQSEGEALSRFRNTFVMKKRPYVILKFAQSIDGFIGKKDRRIWLTNAFSKRLVHKWRSETDAILIGTNTALADNPELTNRLYFGNNPLRIVLDKDLRLPRDLKLYDDSVKTWFITEMNEEYRPGSNTSFINLSFNNQLIYNLLDKLYSQKISSLIVEGGAKLLKNFLQLNLWDEAWVFVSDCFLHDGIKAPTLPLDYSEKHVIGNDQLFVFKNFESLVYKEL